MNKKTQAKLIRQVAVCVADIFRCVAEQMTAEPAKAIKKPSKRRARSTAGWTPEARKAASKRMRARWRNPHARQKLIRALKDAKASA